MKTYLQNIFNSRYFSADVRTKLYITRGSRFSFDLSLVYGARGSRFSFDLSLVSEFMEPLKRDRKILIILGVEGLNTYYNHFGINKNKLRMLSAICHFLLLTGTGISAFCGYFSALILGGSLNHFRSRSSAFCRPYLRLCRCRITLVSLLWQY
jgi:hypothetical protein